MNDQSDLARAAREFFERACPYTCKYSDGTPVPVSHSVTLQAFIAGANWQATNPRDFYLHKNDNYYWTPEAYADYQRLKQAEQANLNVNKQAGEVNLNVKESGQDATQLSEPNGSGDGGNVADKYTKSGWPILTEADLDAEIEEIETIFANKSDSGKNVCHETLPKSSEGDE